jgi:DNA-binding NarL/FixJ family response regulator
MTPDQLVRAITVATKGELVAPRELLGYLITLEEEPEDLVDLSPRQREILELVVEGLSNAEIGRRLYLSESTIKQHLRAAYKLLQVSNRTEAANLFRRGGRN